MNEKTNFLKSGTIISVASVILGVIVASFAWFGIQSDVLPRLAGNFYAAVTTVTSKFIPAEKIVVTAPESVISGYPFTLSFEHQNWRGNGTYEISYTCREGVSLAVLNGSFRNVIDCGDTWPIGKTETELSLVLLSGKRRHIEIPITISHIKENPRENNIKMEMTVMIINETIPEKIDGLPLNGIGDQTAPVPASETAPKSQPATPAVLSKPKPKSETSPVISSPKSKTSGPKTEEIREISEKKTTGNALGKPDLAAKILEIGVVNKTTNEFTGTTTLRSNDRIAVRFVVENLGAKESGDWYFNAALPTFPPHIFTSSGQQNLLPNDRIEFVIGFDSVEKQDSNAVVINADPANSINEEVESNNIASTTINGVVF